MSSSRNVNRKYLKFKDKDFHKLPLQYMKFEKVESGSTLKRNTKKFKSALHVTDRMSVHSFYKPISTIV